jgi:hypothetical protein
VFSIFNQLKPAFGKGFKRELLQNACLMTIPKNRYFTTEPGFKNRIILILRLNILVLKNIRKNRRFIFILVLPVYFFIVQNSLLNKHTHFYANGMVVTHSHPLNHEDENHGEKHSHSKTEICFFQNLKIDYFTINPKIQVEFRNDKLLAEFSETDLLSSYSQPLIQFTSRGPPLRFS